MGQTGRGTIQEMQLLAKSKGGICWSKTYINSKTNLWWECIYGHRWQATPFSVKMRGSWCPSCASNQPLGIVEMNRLAATKKGKCLSNNYVNVKTKLTWECQKGHQFEATPDSIRKGRWCKKCK
tara:strand:+ start:5260 stop:5631 length:372 start_codon:yes stop_codon:yes gene_type:complete